MGLLEGIIAFSEETGHVGGSHTGRPVGVDSSSFSD